ncbi:MAG: M61 family metallopeptidase [Kangiellaceae bacterium]|nr:M61 family metallopeptidase [Kangiellaceae bacterium]
MMRLITLTLLLIFCSLSSAADEGTVKYTLKVTDANHHLADVSVRFPETAPGKFVVQLPAWRTGKYKILNLANGISHFKAFDGNGHQLSVTKIDKSSWQIDVEKRGPVLIGYQLYANQLSDRARHIDDSHLFLDASAGFVYNATYRMSPLQVDLQVPSAWKSRSGMNKVGVHSFVAKDYDQLVDSPIESGIHKFKQFSVEDRQYELVVWGDGNYDLDVIAKDLIKLDGAAKDFWQQFPFKRYVYMVHVAPGLRGATEHLNSTIIHSEPYRFTKRKDYLGFAQIAAHEFVHTWNVKHYRPVGIARYDYQQENYTPSLWIAEGSTSYIQQLLGVRSGTITKKEFLAALAKSINSYMHKAGRKQMSVARASFDAWIGHENDDMSNSTVSIYQEGMLATLVLDYEIRKRTENKKSLEDLHRALYAKVTKEHKGFSESELLKLLSDITGTSFNDFWYAYVHGTDELPLSETLAFYGLELKPEKDALKAWSGLTVTNHNSFALVSSVEKDSPAWQAGLARGDLIISQQNQKAGSDLVERFADYKEQDRVELQFFRKNRLKKATLQLSNNPFPKQKIVPKEGLDSTISARFKSWAGQDLMEATSAE